MTVPNLAPSRSKAQFDALAPFLASMGKVVGEGLSPNPDKPLYHYTDLPGLIGIVKSSGLWLTHSQFCNDSEEHTLGQRVVSEVIAKRKQELAANPAKIEFLTLLEEHLKPPAADGVYICCFCRKENLLSQWRGYGSNGGGVCIEFDPAELMTLTGVGCPYGLLRLWPVVYESARQQQLINQAIDYGLQTFDYLSDRIAPAYKPAWAMQTADALQFFIPTFKNPDFSEENESRLIFTPDPLWLGRPHFRSGRGLLIPYYDLRQVSPAPTLPLLPIRSVTLGPSTNKELNVTSVRMLLANHGYGPEVEVAASKTPYRG